MVERSPGAGSRPPGLRGVHDPPIGDPLDMSVATSRCSSARPQP